MKCISDKAVLGKCKLYYCTQVTKIHCRALETKGTIIVHLGQKDIVLSSWTIIAKSMYRQVSLNKHNTTVIFSKAVQEFL